MKYAKIHEFSIVVILLEEQIRMKEKCFFCDKINE